MKISQDIRADTQRMAGMQQMSAAFREKGSSLYVPEPAGAGVSDA
jgi:hypothetical protein